MSRVRLVVTCLVLCGLTAVAFVGSAPAQEASPVVEEAPPAGQTSSTSEASTTPSPAPEQKPASETTEPSPTSFPLEGPLVVPGSPTEAEEQRAAEEARLASPEAVQAREESELAYSGLNSTESKELASTTFPALIDEPNGGAPKLPEGARITSFSSEFSAAVELPHGEHATLESVAPIAVNTPSGTVPVNLTPQQAGSGFEASTPAEGMHVRAGGKLSEGVSLSDLGITLTAVTENGTALEGNRSVDGASIFYGNSENSQTGISDTDSLIKFDTYGFSEETILRSDNAPQKLYFRVGLPEGASVIQSPGDTTSLQVVDAGQMIAQIAAPSGRDAEGTLVPLTLSVSGDTVTVNVEHQPGQYKLPIEVDPTTYDTQVLVIHNGLTYQSRWKVGTSNGKEGPFYFSEGFNFGIRNFHGENTSPGYAAGEWGGFAYTTQGESSIYDVHVTSSLTDEGHGFEAQAKLTNKIKTGKNEPSASHLDSYSEGSWPGWELCMLSGCAVPTEVTKEIEENSYSLVQYATRTGNYYMNAELWGAWVYIVQTKNSAVSFDTTDPEIASVPNALYGTEHWVRGAAGVVKGIAKDPGIGVSELGFSSPNESKWGISEPFMYPTTALCQGVICPQEETHAVNLTGLPDGKDTVTFSGQNATDTKAQAAKVSATVYLDNTGPHNVALSGLPTSKEIGGGEYKLTAEATDGTAPTPSSGMKSMALLVDGKEVGSLTTPCSPGPCTAHSGTWTIFGHNYATGRHTVTVQATDNAGNVTNELFVMTVHPASPVSMGPGTVNPLSGELSLTATDVSLGGLTASRSYGSQHSTTGENGPVSAQWGFSLGGQESLVRQIDGSLILIDASGGQTIFPSDGKGGYVSPPGDSNLTLSSTPCEAGQTEFMLKNAAAATTTCFKAPTGGNSEILMPSIAKGAVATDTVTYAFESAEPHQARHEYLLPAGSKPFGVTTGPDGNIWFTDEGTSKIGKSTTSGTITEYALPAGSSPHGIVVGPDNNLWFTDRGSSKIGKITTAGTVTEYALPTKSWPEHITKGPDGNLWFVDKGTAKVGKITTAGAITEYALAATSEPVGVTAGPDGNLWVTNFINSKLAATIAKVTTAGVVTEYAAKSCPSDITPGSDGNLWFSNYCNNKIGKITTSGEITEYSLPEKSNPNGITAGPEGKLWFTDRFSSKVGSISTTGAIVEYTAGTSSEPEGIVTGPDKNLWFTEEAAGKISMIAPPEPGAHAIVEPKEALAPVPAGVSCSPELKPGCRALTFNYAESTTATGEAQGEWGDINGHLTRVYYTAYDPTSKAMKTVEVAHYLYGNKKRLRAEWDPRISPALKTVYGYDSEGHLTSLTPPGQETWTFTYGGSPGDGNGGRILKVLQAPASTTLWSGEGVTSTGAPSISGSAVVGNRMTTSDGTWSGKPVSYGYQWEDCNSVGAECAPISGATNANYTPASGDVGHTLVAQVTATNGGGSIAVVSAASSVVRPTTPTVPGYASQFGSVGSGNGQFSSPWDMAANASTGNVYVADKGNNRVEEFSSEGVYVRAWGSEGSGNGQFKHPEGITVDSKGNVWVVDHNNDRVEEFTGEGVFVRAFGSLGSGNGQLNLPEGLAVDSKGNVWVADQNNSRVEEFTGEGAFVRTVGSLGTGNGQLKNPGDVAVEAAGNVWVADTGNNRLEEFTAEGAFVRTAGSPGSGNGQFNAPYRLADGPENTIWVSDTSNNRVQVFTTKGEYEYQFGTAGEGEAQFKSPTGVAFYGSRTYVLDRGNSRVDVWTREMNGERAEGEQRSAQPGATIEYNVPLSGAGLPNLTSGEVEKWAQTDKPTEATAVFPPDELQGWPATGYKRATIYYRDGTSRPVNTATPSGAISTSEYNEHNDVVRSLTADNRVTALKEANPAAAAKLLDTQSEYNSEGTELVSTIGPRHTVKLANGKEVQARSHSVYSYDEGAPTEGGPYRLVTKTTQGAQIEGEAEQDVRTTTNLYSGQGGLGWTLRKPTAVIADPNGLKLTHRTVYDPGTGNVVETRTPGASGPLPHLRYQSSWGTAGQPPIDRAEGVAIDKEGNIWVADTENNRIVELWSNGTLRRTVGSAGTGNAQFSKPAGITADATGNVWVADTGNNRIQELSSTGTYIRQTGKYGSGNAEFKSPRGITVDSTGHVWVADTGNNRVQELSSEAAYVTQYGSQGTGNGQFNQPYAVAVDKEGNIWVGDSANGRIQELSSSGTYIRQFGRGGNTKPCKEEFGTIVCEKWWAEGLTIDAAGHIWVTEASKVEEFSSTGTAITHFGTFGHGEGQVEYPKGIAIDSESHVWLADTGNTRIQEVSSAGAYIRQYPSTPIPTVLNNPKSFARTSAGNWLLADTGNNRLQEVTSGGSFSKQSFYNTNLIEGVGADEKGAIWFSSQDGGYSMIVRESATMAPEWATTSFVGAGEGGNFKEPAGIALAGEKMYVADRGNNRVIEGEKGTYVRKFGTAGSGNGQLSNPQGLAVDGKGNVWVADTGNNRVEEFSPEGAYMAAYGTLGTGNGQFTKPQGVAVDSENNIWVADTGNNRIQVMSSTGVYIQQFGTVGSGTGQMKEPTDVTTDTSHHIYVLDAGNGRVQTWLNEGESEYAPSPHGTSTVYYTTASNSKYPSCGGHPEWANMPCESLPSAQPETPGVPNLPVTTTTYNMYGEPTIASASVGASTRTTTLTYDEAGRNIGSETTSTVGEALPKVNDKYSETTGILTEQYTSTQSLKSVFNAVDQLTSYTDADGNVTTYEYENGGDTRLTHLNDGKGTQTYTYDTTTGAVRELADSAAGTFTATYDVEGNLVGEVYPNAMNANFTVNAVGEAVGAKYVKTRGCAKTCPETWYGDSVVPSVHGQWLSQESNQGTQNYTYDQVGRLTQAQTTPTGKGCITRIYGYDEETNRTSITSREPGTGGVCASEGGTVENHTYDSANRLLDAGTSYDSFGDTTKLPAGDAGGTELTSGFYQGNQLQGQIQNGQTVGYHLDPANRNREVVSTGKITATEVQHYPGPTVKTPSWTGEVSGNYTRYITGISGMLVAIQHNGETPKLQLANLHGDLIATATDSETATELASTVGEASEYGVPATEAPAKYSWLGTHEMPTTLPSGTSAMGVRSYVPQLGRYLQTDPIPGGSANAYAYVAGDPVNTTDLSGAYTWGFGASLSETLNEHGAELAQAYEAAVREEAERLAEAAAAEAAMYAAFEAAGPEEEWGEEEGEEEYAVWDPKAGAEHEAAAREGLLFLPVGEGMNRPQAEDFVVPACKGGSDSRLPCGRRVLRFHWHWWGFSVALSRSDMKNLSHVLAIIGILGAKKFVWQVAAALGVTAEAASILEEHNSCLTLWAYWVPGRKSGQVTIANVSAGIYKCYG